MVDGQPVQWPDDETGDDTSARMRRQLRALTPLARGLSPDEQRLRHLTRPWLGACLAAALLIAATKCVMAVLGAAAPATWASTAVPTPFLTLVVLVFAATGLVLIVGGQRDERARVLGWVNVLTAASFCERQLAALAILLPAPWDVAPAALRGLPVDAFAPSAVWLFVARFPRSTSGDTLQRGAVRLAELSAVIGLGLVLANVALAADLSGGYVAWLDRHDRNSYYWQVAFITLPLVPFVLLARARRAGVEEQRRVRLFSAVVVLGFTPILAISILGSPLSPLAHLLTPERIRAAAVPAFGGLLTVPFSTAWAVLASRVIEVRFLARAAVRAAASRAAISLAVIVPFLVLAARLYRSRALSLEAIVASAEIRTSGALVAVGVLLLIWQPRLRRVVDERLLRIRPEAAGATARVASAVRRARSVRELAEAVMAEVETLYQPSVVAVFGVRPDGQMADSRARWPALPCSSGLGHVLADARGVVTVDSTSSRGLFGLLPTEDRRWVSEVGAVLVWPLRGRDDRLAGALVVGHRRGDLPYSSDDRAVLSATAEAAGVALASLVASEISSPSHPALECERCGTVTGEHAAADASGCAECGGALNAAPLPVVLGGKYRVQARVGRGGMGSVYRATDDKLNRDVAIKALQRVDGRLVDSLLSEARAGVSMRLPGVVQILGVEDWQGVPLLIMEWLPGGVLADRLRNGPLLARETAALGSSLYRTLAAVHARGLAHRDIKPANIGFDTEGRPVLIDLGLAAEAVRRPWATDDVGGTPSYIPPFILAGSSDYARGDVWSLAYTLAETLGGSERSPHRPTSGDAAALLDVLQRVMDDAVAEVSSATAADAARRFDPFVAAVR